MVRKTTYRAIIGQETGPRRVLSQPMACYILCQSRVMLLNGLFSSFDWYIACGYQRSSGLQEVKCERKELVAVLLSVGSLALVHFDLLTRYLIGRSDAVCRASNR
jgi:hypothetical protein